MKIFKRNLLSTALMLLHLSFSNHALSTEQKGKDPSLNSTDIFEMTDQFDQLDKRDNEQIDYNIKESKKCADIEDFICAEEFLKEAGKFASAPSQKKKINDGLSYIKSSKAKREARLAEEQRQRDLAEERRLDREHEADMRRIYRNAMREKAADDARIAQENSRLRQKLQDDSYKFQQEQIRRRSETDKRLQREKEQRERDSIERLNRAYYGLSTPDKDTSQNTAKANEKRLQEESNERLRQEQRDRDENALRLKRENDERIRLQAERKEREEREIELRKIKQEQDKEQREIAKRQERENAMQELRYGTSLSARYCPGNDIRIVGTMPQNAKNKVGCVNVSYLASCPGESMNSGIRGSLYNFQGLATDCYLGDAAKLPRKPSCTAESLSVEVLSINTCSR